MLTQQQQEELEVKKKLVNEIDRLIDELKEAMNEHDSTVKAAVEEGEKKITDLEQELDTEEKKLQKEIEIDTM